MQSKMLSGLLVSFVIVTTLVGLPMASAAVVYVTAVEDGLELVVTAVTDTQYAMAGQHTAYATAWARSPSQRTVSMQRFQANVVVSVAVLPIDPEDGTFWIANMEPKEWCPSSGVTTTYSPAVEPKVVGPWVQLVRTSKSPAPLESANGSANFFAEVTTSGGCVGEVVVYNGIGKNPMTILAKITAPSPDGDGTSSDYGSYARHSIVGGSNHTFAFTFSTTSSNTVSGTISGTADISEHPGVCTVKGPSPTFTNTQVFTVN